MVDMLKLQLPCMYQHLCDALVKMKRERKQNLVSYLSDSLRVSELFLLTEWKTAKRMQHKQARIDVRGNEEMQG